MNYKIQDHVYDAVVVGAGGAGLRLVDKGGIAQNASAMPSAPYVETTGAGASF